MLARICDVCQKAFPYKADEIDQVRFNTTHKEGSKNFTEIVIDICPDCRNAILEMVKGRLK